MPVYDFHFGLQRKFCRELTLQIPLVSIPDIIFYPKLARRFVHHCLGEVFAID